MKGNELRNEGSIFRGIESGEQDRGTVIAVLINMGKKQLRIGTMDL